MTTLGVVGSNWSTSQPRVIVIGGGTGCPAVLRALASFPCVRTAIVTTFDNGGSTGRLRAELNLPALGDLRRALGALAAASEPQATLSRLLEYRFQPSPHSLLPPDTPGVSGHALGNLLLVALYQETGNLRSGVAQAARLLGVQGGVLPVSLDLAHLGARLEDSTLLMGEERIDNLPAGSPPIVEIFLKPSAAGNPEALDAISRADLIVLGPGDLYTSVLPNLLVEGISEAVRTSRARKVWVCNLTNRPGQTDGFTVSTYVREALRYLGSSRLDAILVSDSQLPPGIAPVPLDYEESSKLAEHLIVADLAESDGERHNERRLGQVLQRLLEQLGR